MGPWKNWHSLIFASQLNHNMLSCKPNQPLFTNLLPINRGRIYKRKRSETYRYSCVLKNPQTPSYSKNYNCPQKPPSLSFEVQNLWTSHTLQIMSKKTHPKTTYTSYRSCSNSRTTSVTSLLSKLKNSHLKLDFSNSSSKHKFQFQGKFFFTLNSS